MSAPPPQRSARASTFRFYAELNDFLRARRSVAPLTYTFAGTPSVKDAIEAMGVPHTEIDLILVDGIAVDFGYLLRGGEYISVYPCFERIDIAGVTRLRPEPLRDPRFVLDVHLGKLARHLRLLGFDAAYANDFSDPAIVQLAIDEHRIILTRDLGILKHREVTHGYWLRNTSPRAQIREVIEALDLSSHIRPFTRCMACNGRLAAVARDTVLDQVPADVAVGNTNFKRCTHCRRIYWRGSHYERLARLVRELAGGGRTSSTDNMNTI